MDFLLCATFLFKDNRSCYVDESGVASQKSLLNDKVGQQDQKPILSVRLTGLLMHALLL